MYVLDDLRNAATSTPQPPPAPPAESKMVIERHTDAVVRWLKLKEMYASLRGATVGAHGKLIPLTTHGDVMELAAAWSRELARVEAANDHQRSEHVRWQRCMDTIKKHANIRKLDEVYPRNEEFWQTCTSRLAIYLESRKAVPGKWTLFKEAVADTLIEVPGVVGHATEAAAHAAASAGGAVLDFVKKPVNAALVILGGAILLPPIIRAVRK